MRISVLGTGPVGKSNAARLVELSHEVSMGTRDPEATLARSEPDLFGNPPIRAWLSEHPEVALNTLPAAAAFGDVVVNATNGTGSISALEAAGEDNLAGKVLVDIANPLDFSHGMPPTLTVSNTDSLGEQIQRRFPESKVVKTLNTVNAFVMVDPRQVAGGDHTVFMSGDDLEAKTTVAGLLRSFGWSDIVDLGGIDTARGTEMYLPLWVRLYALGSPAFNIKVVR